MAIKLSELPNEIIYQILLYVPPTSVVKVQQVCRQFNDLLQPILWRHHCSTQFTFWNPDHEIREKLSGPVAKVDWKNMFSARHGVDHMTNQELESILKVQKGRVEKTERIVGHGYDVKDALLRHLNVGEDTNDVLARRFYSDVVLGSLHRKMAVHEWVKIRDSETVPLERALAAFDMFVLHERKGDLFDVSIILDQIADQVRTKIPDFDEWSLRRRAIALANHLRENRLVGINSDANYHDLQNNFIGVALQDVNHSSLPLISVAIFCCVAIRLGIDAHPCGFPFHALAIVKPPLGRTLDGGESDFGQASASMYMDPFRSDQETDVQNLKAQLRSMSVAPVRQSEFLDASPVEQIVRRCAKNIILSVQTLPRHNGAGPMSTVASFPEMDGALYAALWSLMILPEGDEAEASAQRTRYLRYTVEKMETEYLTDVGMIEEHILPFIIDSHQRKSLIETIRVVRAGDQMSRQIKRRCLDTENKVHYSIGQAFRHKRYHYQAVIAGWDVECEAGDRWMETMNVRRLSKGQHQSFYHVLVEDKSVRYVAEENIEPITQDVDINLMVLAGQHFKRWDRTGMKFISNIKDEYPDD